MRVLGEGLKKRYGFPWRSVGASYASRETAIWLILICLILSYLIGRPGP
jgi:hypothetical protein